MLLLQELLLRAKGRVPAHSVVRVGKLRAERGTSTSAIEIAPGDALSGEFGINAAAEALVQSLRRGEAVNASFFIAPLDNGSTAAAFVSKRCKWIHKWATDRAW